MHILYPSLQEVCYQVRYLDAYEDQLYGSLQSHLHILHNTPSQLELALHQGRHSSDSEAWLDGGPLTTLYCEQGLSNA